MGRRTLACIAIVVLGACATPAAAVPVGAIATAPGVIGPPTAHPGNREATLKWRPPNDGGSAVTAYVVVAYRGLRALADQTFAPNGRNVVTAVVTGLVTGKLYWFSVAAVNAHGRGPLSQKSRPVLVGQPGPPGNVTATPGEGQATVSWSAADDNGSAIESYIITPFSGSPLQAHPAHPYHSSATTEVVTGLTNGVQYAFSVRARNGAGGGVYSKFSADVTPAAARAIWNP